MLLGVLIATLDQQEELDNVLAQGRALADQMARDQLVAD
jgi:hypothetical protein